MPISDVFQTVSVERFMEYGVEIRASLDRLSRIPDQASFTRALKKITREFWGGSPEADPAYGRMLKLIMWLTAQGYEDTLSVEMTDDRLMAAARVRFILQDLQRPDWPALEADLGPVDGKTSEPSTPVAPVDPVIFVDQFGLLAGALPLLVGHTRAPEARLLRDVWPDETQFEAAAKRVLGVLKVTGRINTDSTSRSLEPYRKVLHQAATADVTTAQVNSGDWPEIEQALRVAGWSGQEPPRAPIRFSRTQQGVELHLGLRATLTLFAPLSTIRTDGRPWIVHYLTEPRMATPDLARHGVALLQFVSHPPDGEEPTPLFALARDRRIGVLDALRQIEDDLQANLELNSDPEIAHWLPGDWLPPVLAAACLLADRWQVAGRQYPGNRHFVILAYVLQILARYFEQGVDDEWSPFDQQPLSAKALDDLVERVVRDAHEMYLDGLNLEPLEDDEPDWDEADSLAHSALVGKTVSEEIGRASDLARLVIRLGECLTEAPPLDWPARLNWLADSYTGVAQLGAHLAFDRWRIHGRALMAPSNDDYLSAVLDGLWTQYSDLCRQAMPEDAFKALMIDAPLYPSLSVLRNRQPDFRDMAEIAQADTELWRQAIGQAVYAPAGTFAVRLPPDLAPLLPGHQKIVGYIVRDPGLHSIWVRVYLEPEGRRRSSYIVCWVPGQPITTGLLSVEQSAALHLVVTAIYRDLVVAGDRAFPRAADALAPVADQPGLGDRTTRRLPRRNTRQILPRAPRVGLALIDLRDWANADERAYVARRAHHVAGHRRQLPPGQTPRSTAAEEAAADHIILMPGQTYVTPHERGLDGGTADQIAPRIVVARGLAVLITNFCRGG